MTKDLLELWDFGNPALSRERFTAALAGADPERRDVYLTQVARTHGLAQDFDQARLVLQPLGSRREQLTPRAQAYYWLEWGRTWASPAHAPDSLTPQARETARQAYLTAASLADAHGLDHLAVDALHMLVMTDPDPEAQLSANLAALDRMSRSTEAEAFRWEGPLRNNAGYALHLAGRFDEALEQFALSRAAYLRDGRSGAVRIADWMTAWTLRVMGRAAEALAAQLRLEQECAAAGEPDVYVYQELAALYEAQGDADTAAKYRQLEASLAG